MKTYTVMLAAMNKLLDKRTVDAIVKEFRRERSRRYQREARRDPARYAAMLDTNRKWRKRNPERVREFVNRWRKDNLEKVRAMARVSGRRWRQEHPDEAYENRKRYYAKNYPRGNRRYRYWSNNEVALIMDPRAPSDEELALKLDRSIAAIHLKRYVMGGLPLPKNLIHTNGRHAR